MAERIVSRAAGVTRITSVRPVDVGLVSLDLSGFTRPQLETFALAHGVADLTGTDEELRVRIFEAFGFDFTFGVARFDSAVYA